MIKRITLLSLLFCLITSSVYGQQRQDQRRTSAYESLLMRTDRPHAYFDHVSFPLSDSTSQFAFLFRLDYDFIPFMKKNMGMKAPRPEAEYYGPVQVGLEIYEGQAPRRSSNISNSIFRDNWQDTLWVDAYEQTTSREDYAQGIMNTSLDTGEYHYQLQLPRSNMAPSGNPAQRRRELPTPKRNINLTGLGDAEKADFILLKDFQDSGNSFSGTFLNYGDNILYGQDYSVLIRLPANAIKDADSLSLKLYRLIGGANADSQELRHTQAINSNEIVHIGDVNFTNSDSNIGFDAELTDDGGMYAYVKIPNTNFENSRYKITLEKNGGNEILGEKMIQSQWLDMPVSLYNLNVAIDMLRFIVSDEKLDEIDSGSDAERERKFREFWAQRDPSPNTEFNELMTEYYNRIDYAYDEFSSLQVPGFETDQGKAYILYGPPDNVERRLPTNAPTREIWHYPNRTLIFEATTGFGDFKLISEQQG